jgi:hypothetical protein
MNYVLFLPNFFRDLYSGVACPLASSAPVEMAVYHMASVKSFLVALFL